MSAIQKRQLSHDVSADEVAQWFGRRLKPAPSNETFANLASAINRCRWPDDPPIELSCNEELSDEEIAADAARWWDFKAGGNAARTLTAILPKLDRHLNSLTPSPTVVAGQDALRGFGSALDVLSPFIEFPLGKPEDRRGRPTATKPWQDWSLTISHLVIKSLIEAGHKNPAISRNSVLVRVVQRALIRMRIEGAQSVSTTTLSAFLVRWDEFYGLWSKQDDSDQKGA